MDIELLGDRYTGWITLPENHELPHSDSDPIRLSPGETYRYSWTFPDVYTLEEPGLTYPKPPYSIPLKTELRVVVTYFEDEGDWQAYLNESKAPTCFWGCMEPLLKKWGHQAFSDPFKLPPTKPSEENRSPAPQRQQSLFRPNGRTSNSRPTVHRLNCQKGTPTLGASLKIASTGVICPLASRAESYDVELLRTSPEDRRLAEISLIDERKLVAGKASLQRRRGA